MTRAIPVIVERSPSNGSGWMLTVGVRLGDRLYVRLGDRLCGRLGGRLCGRLDDRLYVRLGGRLREVRS